jgi:hypothetical protein
LFVAAIAGVIAAVLSGEVLMMVDFLTTDPAPTIAPIRRARTAEA